MNITCGLLIYKIIPKLQVFLVHPGGPFWSKKDIGVWSIPKGVAEIGESFESAAIREFQEETGFDLVVDLKDLLPLGEQKLHVSKLMHCFALEKDIGNIKVKSNLFEMEWPFKSGKFEKFSETDKGEYFEIEVAKEKLNPKQVVFLDRLEKLLN